MNLHKISVQILMILEVIKADKHQSMYNNRRQIRNVSGNIHKRGTNQMNHTEQAQAIT